MEKILWKKILLEILEKEIAEVSIITKNNNLKQIINNSKLKYWKVDELINVLDFLKEVRYFKQKIIEETFQRRQVYTITKEGMEAALKLQEHNDNKDNQRNMLFFTGIVAAGATAQILTFVNIFNKSVNDNWLYLLLIIILILLLWEKLCSSIKFLLK